MILQGTEFDNEKLDLLLIADFELKRIIRFDLENKKFNMLNIPESGIPKHFKVISKQKFCALFNKYFIMNKSIPMQQKLALDFDQTRKPIKGLNKILQAPVTKKPNFKK